MGHVSSRNSHRFSSYDALDKVASSWILRRLVETASTDEKPRQPRGGATEMEKRTEESRKVGRLPDCYESGFTRSRWTGSQGKGDTSLLCERGKALSCRV